MCGENNGEVGTRFKRIGDNIGAERKTVRIFDDDAWRLARSASRLQNKSGEPVGSAALQRGRWLNGFRGLGRERGNR